MVRMFATFDPERLDDLKPEFAQLVGQTLEFEYFGTSNDDEPYPGQKRWGIVPHQDGIDNDKHAWRWVPECDLRTVQP